jgi:endonuclease/exonuclease/phosphatase family metal-dependent hydrolase
VRLASFNILHGRSPDDGVVDVERLTSACASIAADVLGMQEVDRNQVRSDGQDQTAMVAEAVDAVAWRFEPAIVGEPAGNWRPARDGDADDTGRGGYGVGLVSRLPVHAWHVVRLPAAPLRSPVYATGSRRLLLLRDEPRVGLAAEVETPVGRMTIATAHLSFVPGWNAMQLRRLTRALRRRAPANQPCILMGDLNLPGASPGWASGWRRLARVKTFPAPNPSVQIDHALADGRVPPVRAANAWALPVSDHRALVVDLADGARPAEVR